MFERILVPLDGSSRAEQALPVAARLAHASSGSIHLLQVLSLSVEYDGGMAPISLVSEQSVEAEMDVATNYLNSVAVSPALKGIHITTEATFGLPAQCILTTATAREVDLIVLCSHGRTGFLRWSLGSVAHTLAHESKVPLLVLRASEPASLLSRTGATRPLCALVPLDGSELSEAALVPAAYLVTALASPTQGALHLTQVVPRSLATAEESVVWESREEAKTYLTQKAERMQTTAKDLKVALTSSIERENDVSSALLSLAEHGSEGKEAESVGRCNLIAISTHGRGGMERWVMGSVTERLLTHTTLPMLIVRPKMVRGDA